MGDEVPRTDRRRNKTVPRQLRHGALFYNAGEFDASRERGRRHRRLPEIAVDEAIDNLVSKWP